MSQIKITELPSSGTLTGDEVLPVVQNGATKQASVQEIADLANPYDYTPEDVANKSTNVTTDGSSDIKYPSVKAVKDYADGMLVGLLSDQGNWSAAGNVFPSTRPGGGAIQKGDLWYISANGTLGGTPVLVGYSIRALANTPGQTAANWGILNVGLGFVPEDVANKSTNTSLGTSNTLYPTQNAVKTYVDSKPASALQSVIAGSNRNLADGNNFQGTGSGPASTVGKNDISAFGTDAAAGYTGTGDINAFGNQALQNATAIDTNAMGQSAGKGSIGNYSNFFGASAGENNSGASVNALGQNAAKGNIGANVNAFGSNAGVNNDYSNVNLFGGNAAATAGNQTVFTKNGTQQVRLDYNGVTANRTYTLPDADGTLGLDGNITLQKVTESSRRSLIDGINSQGTSAGPAVTTGKSDINAFGENAARVYGGTGSLNALGNGAAEGATGNNINALGKNAVQSSTGNDINGFGFDAAKNSIGSDVNAFGNGAVGGMSSLNTGDNINAFGNGALSGVQSGSNVNAFGKNAGQGNAASNVNLFGEGAQATGNNQTVFAIDAANQAIINFSPVVGVRTFALPNASGTLALTSQLPVPQNLQSVTTTGNTTTTDIIVSSSTAKTIKSQNPTTSAAAELTYGGSNNNGVLKLTRASGGFQLLSPNSGAASQEIILPAGAGTLGLDSDITLQKITDGTRKNLTSGNNYQGTGAGTGASGSQKIHIGADAGKNNGGTDNVTLGQNSGAYTSTGATVTYGASNVAIGKDTLSNTSIGGTIQVGEKIIAIGDSAGKDSRGQASNTNKILIGNQAGQGNPGLNNVIAIGALAGKIDSPSTTGNHTNNIFIGQNAGRMESIYTSLGSDNVLIGNAAGQNGSGSRNVYIGSNNPIASTTSGNTAINGAVLFSGSNQVGFGNGLPKSSGGRGVRFNFDNLVDGEYTNVVVPRPIDYDPGNTSQALKTMAFVEDTYRKLTLTLTHADILALNTPLEILSLPLGSVLIQSIVTKLSGPTAYSGGVNLYFKYITPNVSGFATTSSPLSAIGMTMNNFGSSISTTGDFDGSSIAIGASASGTTPAAPTGGNAANTLTITITYITI
jgi:hypothetical protein